MALSPISLSGEPSSPHIAGTPFLQDRFGRRINYLRVSLTEHCNFRCQYCSPAEGTPYFRREDHLRPEELDLLLTVFAQLGVAHVRFTGGEPLIYPWLMERVAHARALGIPRISLSSNGYLLDRLAAPLAQAGVNKLNVSLDSLDPVRFSRITRGGDLARVLRGLQAAKAAGIARIKLNVVLLRHENLNELGDLLAYAAEQGFDIQFIETMPLGTAGSEALRDAYVSVAEAKSLLARRHVLQPQVRAADEGPSRLFALQGASIRVGFISAISENFCSTCNRVRLTATGRLVYCLGQEAGIDLLPLLRGGIDADGLADFVRRKVWEEKPERHFFVDEPARAARVFMMRLGG